MRRPILCAAVLHVRSAVALGAIVLVAGAGVTVATAATPTTTTTSPATTVAAGSSTTTTLPPLPVPVDAPGDNEVEPQSLHGRLQIPAIEVDSPFLEGIRISTLDYGPGHWPGTAMPGELGNVVVAGHRTSHNADFRRLDELVPGDQVVFELDLTEGFERDDGVEVTSPTPDVSTGRHVYVVHSVEIVPPDAMWVVTQDYRHSATLFACHPPGSVAERIVVFLDLVDPTTLELVDPPLTDDDDFDGQPGRLTAARRALCAVGRPVRRLLAASVGLVATRLRRRRRLRAVARRRAGARCPAGLAFVFAFAWLATGMAWMWQLTPPGYLVAGAVHGLFHAAAAFVALGGRWGTIGRPLAHTLAEALRFSWPFGGVPLASVAIAEAAGPFAGTVRVGGAIALTWVVWQIGVALGDLVRRACRRRRRRRTPCGRRRPHRRCRRPRQHRGAVWPRHRRCARHCRRAGRRRAGNALPMRSPARS